MIGLIRNKVAVEPIHDPDKIGSIYVPDQAKERCDQGIVKYIGPEVTSVGVGDYVLFSGYTGQTIKLEDEGILIIMPEDFIVLKIEPPDTSIRGIYFKDEHGVFFPATYEQVFYLIARQMQEEGTSERFKIKNLKESRPR